MSRQIIIIGGGPAGVEAARAAAKNGAEVTVVSTTPVGGRAGWASLLPSKVWLTAADSLGLAAVANLLGLTGDRMQPSPGNIVARIKKVKAAWNGHIAQDLADLGVRVVQGTAVFQSPTTVLVKKGEDDAGETMSADAFIVATGSVPIFPPTMKPNGTTIIAPRFASALDELPPSIAVIGAGATGSEFVYLFNRMGVKTTWIVDQFGVLPDFDLEAGQFLAETLAKRGVNLVEGQMADHIDQTDDGVTIVLADGSQHEAAMAFVAIGRQPDTANLNPEMTGVALEKGTVVVDGYGRSSQPHIYFAGDVTGAPMVANRAMAQAWVAGQHAAGASPTTFQPETVVAAIYTEPQVAQVGRLDGLTVERSFQANLKARLLPHSEGFVKLAYDEENGRLLGGAAVGPHAADMLAPVAVAIQAGTTIQAFGNIFAAHPTMSELAFAAARQV